MMSTLLLAFLIASTVLAQASKKLPLSVCPHKQLIETCVYYQCESASGLLSSAASQVSHLSIQIKNSPDLLRLVRRLD